MDQKSLTKKMTPEAGCLFQFQELILSFELDDINHILIPSDSLYLIVNYPV